MPKTLLEGLGMAFYLCKSQMRKAIGWHNPGQKTSPGLLILPDLRQALEIRAKCLETLRRGGAEEYVGWKAGQVRSPTVRTLRSSSASLRLRVIEPVVHSLFLPPWPGVTSKQQNPGTLRNSERGGMKDEEVTPCRRRCLAAG